MSFFDDILDDRVSASQIASNTNSGVYSGAGFSLSSGLQQFLNIGTGYAKGLTDLELARRTVKLQQQAQQPNISTTQSPIYFNEDLTSRGVSAVGGMRVGNLLPFILLGVGAYVLLGKRG